MRRIAVLGACCIAWLCVPAVGAQAHALLVSSEPADGSQVSAAPSQIVLRFTEEVDRRLSSLRILDATGRVVADPDLQRSAKSRRILVAGTSALSKGTYTVAWRVVSSVDGHLTGGAFAFGVGVAPDQARAPAEVPRRLSPFGVAGRALFYAGLVLLIGAALFSSLVRGPTSPALLRVGAAAAFAGLLAFGHVQRADAGVSLRAFLGTSLGHAFIARLVPVVIAVGLVARRKMQAPFIALAGGAAVIAHVMAGHAATGSLRAAKIAVQSVHILAASAWIGGLVALVVSLRSLPVDARPSVVRRFSRLAFWSLLVVLGAGVARSVAEVGSWSAATRTSFGRVVVAKVALLGVLAALGAVNRFRGAARAQDDPSLLIRVGRIEIVVAVAVLALTGTLSSVTPPVAIAQAAAARAADDVVVSGADFATTMRLTLRVSPGFPGRNRFIVELRDYDTRDPLPASRVALRFSLQGGSGVGSSTLELRRRKTGTFAATASNLSIDGPWRVTVIVERGEDSTEVPLNLRTRAAPQQVSVTPGDPTLYTIALADGRSIQMYVDPARVGPSEVHATFFEKGGTEFRGLTELAMTATDPAGVARALDVRILSPGHFVADLELRPGRWRFDASARAGDAVMKAHFEPTIQGRRS